MEKIISIQANIENLIRKENNYNNPYIALATSLASNLDGSIVNLIDFISKNTKADINEKFFYRTSSFDYGQEVIAQGTLASILTEASFNKGSDWDTGTPQELFSKLYSLGASFDGIKTFVFEDKNSLATATKIVGSTSDIRDKNLIFEDIYKEEKAIYLLNIAHEQMDKESFLRQIKESKTLHQAVSRNHIKLIKFLIEDCKVSENITDDKNLTPIFMARRPETLDLLSKYNTDWFHLNSEGKDCLNIYTSIGIDKSLSSKMIDIAKKQMEKSILSGEKDEFGKDYLEERIKKNLLEMVEKDKTKKELNDFIKKNDIKNISEIKDEKGNNLALLCLMKQNWARYNIFKEECGIDTENNLGTSPIEVMLSKKIIKREDEACKVLDELLSKKVYEKNNIFSSNMIRRAINKNEPVRLPSWYFGKKNSPLLKLYKEIAHGNEQLIESFSTKYSEAEKNSGFGYRYSSSDIASGDIAIYFLLTHAVLFNKNFKLDNISLKKVFPLESSWLNKDVQYMATKKESLNNIKKIIDICEQEPFFKKLDVEKLKENLENTVTSSILVSLDNIRKHQDVEDISNNRNILTYFFSDNEEMLKYLISIKSKVFSEIVDERFIKDFESISEEREVFPEIEKGLKFLFLNKEIKSEVNKNVVKKLKI